MRISSLLPAFTFCVSPEKAFFRQLRRSLRRVRSYLVSFHDEVLKIIPGFEKVVDGQDMKVQEELAAAAEAISDQAVMPLRQFKDGVRQECENVDGGQRVGQVLLAVPKVVIQMVALGLEYVVVTVLDSPPGAGACGQFHSVSNIHIHVGRPAVAVGLSPSCIGYSQLDPVYP